MAVFGLPFGRWQTLQLFDSRLRQWQTSGRLTKLHIVGPNDDKFSPQSRELVRTWPNTDIVVDHGILSPAGVSGILSHIRFGLSNANAETWSKSAVFMAYAAHGCAIIAEINSQAEPLRFVVGPEEVLTISDIDLAARTASLKNWYERNANWSVVAQQISALLPLNIREVAIK
jgi:hypothetical protein